MTARTTLALVGGTGLTELGGETGSLAIDTPFGNPSAPLQVLEEGPVRLLFLPRHGSPHRLPPHCVNYRANMWALRKAGAQHVLAVSAVGGITEKFGPGTVALPDQLIDYTWGRQHTFSDSDQVPLVHVDFTHPYNGALRTALMKCAQTINLEVVTGGCIGVFQGPRLESAAEVNRARRDGCDMAGMTSLPEAGLARELGLDYAGIAVVSNWGAGVKNSLISEEDIAKTLKAPMERVRKLVRALIDHFATETSP